MFIVNVEGAIYKDEKWLIIKRSEREKHAGGLLSLVGGKVSQEGHSNDILERTVKREIYEEVGLTVKDPVQYVHSTTFITDHGKHVVNVTFLCRYTEGVAYAKSPDEVDKVMWLTTNDIIDHPNVPDYVINSIQRAQKLL